MWLKSEGGGVHATVAKAPEPDAADSAAHKAHCVQLRQGRVVRVVRADNGRVVPAGARRARGARRQRARTRHVWPVAPADPAAVPPSDEDEVGSPPPCPRRGPPDASAPATDAAAARGAPSADAPADGGAPAGGCARPAASAPVAEAPAADAPAADAVCTPVACRLRCRCSLLSEGLHAGRAEGGGRAQPRQGLRPPRTCVRRNSRYQVVHAKTRVISQRHNQAPIRALSN